MATNSIILICAATTFQVPFAVGIAASVRIGNLLGEKNAQDCGIVSNVAIFIAVGFSLVTRLASKAVFFPTSHLR